MDTTPASSEFALDALEALRKRLLDLSARNRLLNFSHGRSGCIRCVDERPDQLHELLLSEEELRFVPIPQPSREQLLECGYLEIDEATGKDVQLNKLPSASEWAAHLGIESNFELPSVSNELLSRHQDRAIQTLLYPDELETQLRNLRNKAETAIEETGANILFLAFGFLEWYESAAAETPRLAPLYLVPVRLNRGRLDSKTGTYVYTLSYTGEDILPNLSLREKLRIDFKLALPELNEEVPPEQYLSAVQAVIEHAQPRWTVRRYATMALLNFGRLLMYLDLDPDRWPSGARHITQHPVVQRFFTSRSEPAAVPLRADEHPIDELPNVHERYPLIDDADSSQHSAMIDALDGSNLVIEGPPGTGKSQTITNLIAAALAQGKKVLFIAEKLAALEVVKNRLDRAGLGDFCLELHSHKTQKRKVLDDIHQRLTNQGGYRAPKDFSAEMQRYEELKEVLRGHAEENNGAWRDSGRTIYDILLTAAYLRDKLQLNPTELHPRKHLEPAASDSTAQRSNINHTGDNTISLDQERQRALHDQVGTFAAAFGGLLKQLAKEQSIQGHPWYGVRNSNLQFFDTERIVQELGHWQSSLKTLHDKVVESTDRLRVPSSSLCSITDVKQFLADVERLPPLHGDEHLAALPHLKGAVLSDYRQFLNDYDTYQKNAAKLSQLFVSEVFTNKAAEELLLSAVQEMETLGVDANSDTRLITSFLRQIEELKSRLTNLAPRLGELNLAVGPAFAKHVKLSVDGLRQLNFFLQTVKLLKPALWTQRGDLFLNDTLDELLPELEKELERLHGLRQTSWDWFRLNEASEALPDRMLLHKARLALSDTSLLRWFKLDWWQARKFLKGLATDQNKPLTELQKRLPNLISYAEGVSALQSDPRYVAALRDRFQGLATPVADLIAIRGLYRQAEQTFGVGFGPRVDLGQALLSMPTQVAKGVLVLIDQGLEEQVQTALKELEALGKFLPKFAPLSQEQSLLIETASAQIEEESTPVEEASAPAKQKGPLVLAHEHLAKAFVPMDSWIRQTQWNIEEVRQWLAELREFQGVRTRLAESRLDRDVFQGALNLSLSNCHDVQDDAARKAACDAARHTELLATVLEHQVISESVRKSIYMRPSKAVFDLLGTQQKALAEAVDEAERAQISFAEATHLDLVGWAGTDAGLDDLIKRNDRGLSQPEWLVSWTDYLRRRALTRALGAEPVIQALERRAISPEQALDALELGITDLLARDILRESPHLAQFSGLTHEALQQQFCQYDERLKLLQRQRMAWEISQNQIPEGVMGGKVSNYTELALLKHECGKKVRHVPIRQLVRRAGQALVALKPCFMMGPMAVAQYLAPGEIEFDLIVMDEASQVKPEDALGAIARGKQVVIVGDPKQLPPTSFFDRATVEEETEDMTAIEESESILEVAAPMFTNRRLRWHYRSQHESLIAFSNKAFYQDLVVFPSPHGQSPSYGVKFHRVAEGCFVNRRNVPEAQAIAVAIAEHLQARPSESLGVVAMSSEQRDQIEKELESLAKINPALEAALEGNRLQPEPLFIKNLENVQGDERDVIFISCTYGPSEPGNRVPQRFGPINTSGGWRRLNVLFTRSKKRMEVFSSMSPEEVVISDTASRGVKAFHDFLVFAQQSHNAQRVNQPGASQDSTTVQAEDTPQTPFEKSLAGALADSGFEAVARVGVAGCYVDLAVRDPQNPGRYVLALESDGPHYHAARTVRDRDRLRQAVLKRLGWQVQRVWAVDWYKNPQAVMSAIKADMAASQTDSSIQDVVSSSSDVGHLPHQADISLLKEQPKPQN